ncbi:50S ribosomal protein L15 [Aliarcobacter thereius]|uniref:Large ribosomal subunit protein uL15 n=2 Tax=Aliarcobacter thereius TaxID=544718 RepID=A0A1C0B3X5_9BACT|nr:50S ribosomal protein L15 [Aliarcobacter thereius]OCL86372.1 50S ribosomal protein L15 [Aliarcobacter thereius]OCL90058.1 50S ribosomal protein L15 [Aliarcobacter thereius]OCL96342.1 50S ribosomal protein L15 [Aliarcobacter thereius LMG 24486]OCL97069.1 50S ribosomal protein L15 [Aliarcobacter thereius]QBF15696.1 50S ribosomal protein L15 [Aliarcobacter thereius LMG 24486]
MILDNLQAACGSTREAKRKGRGQGSGNGKTAGKGHKGQRARAGYNVKRGFEGGQQPLSRRLPKVGFVSRVVKPYSLNVDKITAIASLDEITLESIKTVYKLSKSVEKVKLIGATAKNLSVKIKDENVTTTGK